MVPDDEYISKKLRIREIRSKLDEVSRDKNLAICFDLGWAGSMSTKEISKLASQIGRIHGANKKASRPAKVYFTSFEKTSMLYQECLRKHIGFEQFPIEMDSKPHHELFAKDDIVILSPDAQQPLEQVELGKVYVIGGIVDETRKKQLTLDQAEANQITARRLPIREHLELADQSKRGVCTILAANQVFEILLKQFETGCWTEALKVGVPPRKGFKIWRVSVLFFAKNDQNANLK